MNRLSIIAPLFALISLGGQSAFAQSGYDLFQKGLVQERVKGDLDEAIRLYKQIAEEFTDDHSLTAKALIQMGGCYEKLGRTEAQKAYQRVIEEYPGQKQEVAIAKERIAKLSSVLAKGIISHEFREVQIPNRIQRDAQLSPDGKKIASGFENKLWIMPRFGPLGSGYAGVPQLLNTGEIEVENFGFTWSADGQWIAFNGREVTEGNQRIYVVSADGGELRQVHENNRGVRIVNYRMSLSPHGDTLAFTLVDANELHIYTLSIDGGSPKKLVDAPARDPVFSPDGKIIAYVEDKNLGRGGGGVWTVPADGGTPTLVANAGNASSPIWSPEGGKIAFLDEVGNREIYIVPIDEDGKPAGQKVTIGCPKGKVVTRLAGWTPDNEIGALFRTQIEYALYTQPVQGGQATFVTHGGGGYPLQPRWSPDGKQIYHTNRVGEARGGWQGLVIAHVPAEGGDVTTVPIQSEDKIVIGGYGSGIHVSPDGNTIVFAGRKSQDDIWHIWTLPIEGGKPKQLTDDPSPFTDCYPCWSPDGKAIAFLRGPTSENLVSNIYIIPANGGEHKQLTSESDSVFNGTNIAWSPDGKLLAYFSRDKNDAVDGTLKVIPAQGGEPQVVAKVLQIFANKEMAWSPDGKRIAYNAPGNKIKIVSLDDGSIVEIEPDLKDVRRIYHLDWSPNGESLIFGSYTGGELGFWVMENFLPEIEPKGKVVRHVCEASGWWKGCSISPLGRFFAFSDRKHGYGEVSIYDLSSGMIRRLTNDANQTEGAYECVVSPDGEQIAYCWLNSSDKLLELRLVGTDGSRPRTLYRDKDGLPIIPFDWSPDGKEILVFHKGIAMVSVDDGSVRFLKKISHQLLGKVNMRISPDGRYIAYDLLQKGDITHRDIYILSTDGRYDAPLIDKSSKDVLLDWCPDGKSLLFRSDRTGSWDAWRIRVKEGKPDGAAELVKKDVGSLSSLGFTRDGSFYFMSTMGGMDIYTAKIDLSRGKIVDGPENPVERGVGRNVSAAWSPDGKYLAYIAARSIHIRSEETGEEKEISPQPGFYGIEWFPDGLSLKVYGEDAEGNRGVFRVDIKTGAVETILMQTPEVHLHRCYLGHEGKNIYYRSYRVSENLSSIFAYEIYSKKKKEIWSGEGKVEGPVPSPDGKWLAMEIYQADGSSSHLAVMPIKGGEIRELAESSSGGEFAWTPDSKQLLFAKFVAGNGWGSSRQELWVVPLNGGAPKSLNLESRMMWLLTMHPDGERIAYTSDKSKAEIWAMDNFLPKSTTSK